MDVRLVVEQGKTRTRTLHLRKAEAVIGRQRGCDFRIAASDVSRRHCVLRVRDGYVTVEDLNSRNGTQLNGEPVEGSQVVRPGDRLRIGPLTFVVEYQLTPEAIDLLLRGEDGAEAQDLDVLEEVGAEPAEEAGAVGEEGPVALEGAEVVDAGDWQLPESEELRDILTGLDEDEDSAPKKKKE